MKAIKFIWVSLFLLNQLSGVCWSTYMPRFQWESHLFALPHKNSFSAMGQLCAQHSTKFCFMGYYVQGRRIERANEFNDEFIFFSLIQMIHKNINWFSFTDSQLSP
ncbi:uncharacterized protein LOC142355781, partial [Convolutriloba macropyga]|uniref:uncharacterized protein LOC142355781 n=1 Tax=Convolutriloba macropyga TaxID=536237 RepID=UPI003F528C09